MATIDKSRNAFNPKKHYSSVRMQQGRVIVDDDWNENERIANEDCSCSRIHIIGPAGTPDQGFRIENPRIVNDLIDFDILPGSFYLGGLRLEIEEGERYRLQKDWLQQSHELHQAPDRERFDLVCLEAWQQPVGAVEDSELFEVALGGPDTSMRVRNMRRVLIETDVQTIDCALAWQTLIERWRTNNRGWINGKNERVHDARLSVSYYEEESGDDLCTPLIRGGYLGAENQTIRVQLVDENHFTWGFDNASPLYRVQINGDGRTVRLITDPKDQAHWPLSGQIVEILPWSAVLPNGEKIADIKGHLSSIEQGYDPDNSTIILTDPVDSGFGGEWASREDASELDESPGFFFMRVWNRGSDRVSEPSIPFTFSPGNPVRLGHTGLQITITGNHRIADDYWIIAARPETPNRVVPWAFEDGLPPHGVRRFYAPLALIHWRRNEYDKTVGEIANDCRKVFRPLTNQKLCCSLIVGDGVHTHGDCDSIEDAINYLPSSGGKICLLPGIHEANVRIEGRKDIVIKGCRNRTIIRPREGHRDSPVFHIVNSSKIILEYTDITTLCGTAILLEETGEGKLRDIEIHNNRIHAYMHAVRVQQGNNINIHHNKIHMLDKEGGGVAIYLFAEDSVIERNEILVVPAENSVPPAEGATGEETQPDPTNPCVDMESIYLDWYYFERYINHIWNFWGILDELYPATPFNAPGGIQIAGGSERIKIAENKINGGRGNGITLGNCLNFSDIFSPIEIDIPGEGITPTIITVTVNFQGNPLNYINVFFEGSTGVIYPGTTAGLGYFQIALIPGHYNVYVIGQTLDQIYRIESVEVQANNYNYTFNLIERGIDFSNLFASIYEINIEENQISNMGLSGIGAPLIEGVPITSSGYSNQFSWIRDQMQNTVVDLKIYKNHIVKNLQNPFDSILRAEARERGLGGISLGQCSNLSITGNYIANNGVSHVMPVCGIYIKIGENADINHNKIIGNGPIQDMETPIDQIEQGIRGGIVFYRNIYIYSQIRNCIHDNVVDQPAGHALLYISSGWVSIINNQFNSELSVGGDVYPVFGDVGAVVIKNQTPPLSVLFTNNQSRVGPDNRCKISQYIEVLGDIGFIGNQSDNYTADTLIANTILYGATVRASNNRLKEPSQQDRLFLSLFTLSHYINNTTCNQGDHCIIPVSHNFRELDQPLIKDGNQTLYKNILDPCSGFEGYIINRFAGGILDLSELLKMLSDVITEFLDTI